MNLGERLISVPCHFDSYCILLFNCCREPRVYFSAVYFFPWHLQTVTRVKQYRTQQGMCYCTINCMPLCPRGRRPEADCLLPPEKSDNGLTVHFLEDFSVIIKYKWRDLLERKKMRRLFKLPSRLRASSTDRALVVDGVRREWGLSFTFSGTRTENSVEFFGSSVSLIMTLGGMPLWQCRRFESINLFSL